MIKHIKKVQNEIRYYSRLLNDLYRMYEIDKKEIKNLYFRMRSASTWDAEDYLKIEIREKKKENNKTKGRLWLMSQEQRERKKYLKQLFRQFNKN